MRIAFISYDLGEYCIRHTNALLDHGKVLLLLPRRIAEPHLDLLSPAVDFRPFHKARLRQPVRQIRQLWTVLRHLSEFRPDVVHLQLGHLWFNLALPLIGKYPLVLSVHDAQQHPGDRGAANTPQSIRDFGYRRADHLIVHAAHVGRLLQYRLNISAERIHRIPHIAIGERPSRQQVAESPHQVLFFGRIWPYKGLDYLIRAQPKIRAAIPDARVVIAGRGEEMSKYRSLMRDPAEFEVHNRWIDEDERVAFFQRASVVVLPYTEASQSGVVPMAYTFGKPVIATRTGGLPEVVEHGETGLLVSPRDEDALADAIIKLLRDGELRRRLGRKGREKLLTEWSPKVVARQTADVYLRAIADRRGSLRPPTPSTGETCSSPP
jgi:glycosyltransferase involved in cell wall biosynthesis